MVMEHDAKTQRLVLGVARILIGLMWFQQTLWKLPWEHYEGLGFWLKRASDSPKFLWYKYFIDNIVVPNLTLFGFQIWLTETFIAASLLLGLFARLGGLISGLLALNILIAMWAVPGEWYWTYVFIILLGFIFFAMRAGRYIGFDRILAPRIEAAAAQKGGVYRLSAWLV